jgi:hypothetical protein
VTDWASLRSCQDLTDAQIGEVIESRDDVRVLLEHLAAVARPGQGGPRVLLLFARLATPECDWLEGALQVVLKGDGQGTAIESYAEIGAGLRERVVPRVVLPVPVDEFLDVIARFPHLIAPLAVFEASGSHAVLGAHEAEHRVADSVLPDDDERDLAAREASRVSTMPLTAGDLPAVRAARQPIPRAPKLPLPVVMPASATLAPVAPPFPAPAAPPFPAPAAPPFPAPAAPPFPAPAAPPFPAPAAPPFPAPAAPPFPAPAAPPPPFPAPAASPFPAPAAPPFPAPAAPPFPAPAAPPVPAPAAAAPPPPAITRPSLELDEPAPAAFPFAAPSAHEARPFPLATPSPFTSPFGVVPPPSARAPESTAEPAPVPDDSLPSHRIPPPPPKKPLAVAIARIAKGPAKRPAPIEDEKRVPAARKHAGAEPTEPPPPRRANPPIAPPPPRRVDARAEDTPAPAPATPRDSEDLDKGWE